jgi:ABC-type transporter Mla MlaB component
MLKVTRQERDDGIILVLEGRLCGACAAEAERSWRSALAGAGTGKIVIDLGGVSYVDPDGESLLRDMLEQGATVRVGGVWMGHLIEELQRRVVRNAPATSRRAPRPHRSPGVS